MRKRWTEEDVVSELAKICSGIGRMVTVRDLKEMGRNDLACQISRRGGFEVFTKKLGYDMTESDSHFGWEGEAAVAKKLTDLGYQVTRMPGKRDPFDMIVNRVVRVDVKTASYADYGYCTGWFYRLGKVCPADLVVLYQFDTGDMHLVPWVACPVGNITITKTGKTYEPYKNNFSIIDKVLDAFPWKRILDVG